MPEAFKRGRPAGRRLPVPAHGSRPDRAGDRRSSASPSSPSPARSAGGHAVQRAAAERFIATGLELGGKDPAYVRADADLALRGREPRRRRLLQLRPVLLRHRAHLRRTATSTSAFVDGFVDAHAQLRARQSARTRTPRSARWCAAQAAGARARRRSPRPSRKGAEALIDPRLSRGQGGHALPRAAGAGRRRPRHAGHDARRASARSSAS